ncbi:unnamed protein product, partial [Dovyalis caffra]
LNSGRGLRKQAQIARAWGPSNPGSAHEPKHMGRLRSSSHPLGGPWIHLTDSYLFDETYRWFGDDKYVMCTVDGSRKIIET